MFNQTAVMAFDVPTDMAGDVAGDVSLTAQFWKGPIQSEPNFCPTFIIS